MLSLLLNPRLKLEFKDQLNHYAELVDMVNFDF